ncbi:DJ-1/PfpI family protein [Paenibacillus sp. GSMTC-2017]|uniref:DJ-1/PfpI family protein n=1 Tax=Paenibacillus sp. GSMTC-2017 TaxID=2794350 RepID=UPI0018D5E1A7|nr:DJ-1/PfpI family protein [Paenibacillus sp. GSMTC-2017]MBH5317847.1 DJ-1/PfpI family protein [Paenibacillus sp. GSMTC-2017]
MMQTWNVGILLFENVEVLDFAGPFEVFSITMMNFGKPDYYKPFKVSTVSETGGTITAEGGLKVVPDYSIARAPYFDLIVIPGGGDVSREVNNDVLIDWIKTRNDEVKWMTSVCSGAQIVAKTGILDGKQATNHSFFIKQFRIDHPKVDIIDGVKYVDQGDIVTSAGVSSGIQMALHMVRRLLGKSAAEMTAEIMEFEMDFDDATY